LPDRGKSPLRLHKAHVEGKQAESAQDPETPISPLKPVQPILKKVGLMKPLQGPTPVGQEESASFFRPRRRGAGWKGKKLGVGKSKIAVAYLAGLW
jgi:hypothetical protein